MLFPWGVSRCGWISKFMSKQVSHLIDWVCVKVIGCSHWTLFEISAQESLPKSDTSSVKTSAEPGPSTRQPTTSTVYKPTAQVQPLQARTQDKPEKPAAAVTSTRASVNVRDEEEGEVVYDNMGRPQSCVRITDLHRYIQQEKSENPNHPFHREFTVS